MDSHAAIRQWADQAAMEFGPGWKGQWFERIPDDRHQQAVFRLVLEKRGVCIQNEVWMRGDINSRASAFQMRLAAKQCLLKKAKAQLPL